MDLVIPSQLRRFLIQFHSIPISQKQLASSSVLDLPNRHRSEPLLTTINLKLHSTFYHPNRQILNHLTDSIPIYANQTHGQIPFHFLQSQIPLTNSIPSENILRTNAP